METDLRSILKIPDAGTSCHWSATPDAWAPPEERQKLLPKLLKCQSQLRRPKKSLLLLLLSHFSRVWLCATSHMAAHQAPPSLGFSRQEHWSGLPFPSPMQESEKWKWSHSVVSDFPDPMDCSPPGSSIHGGFQARVLEWGAIAFSKKKKKKKVPTKHKEWLDAW